MVLPLVYKKWLRDFLSFWIVFIEFYCCNCRLTSFYCIPSFFVSYYLTMVIPNIMLYSINFDASIAWRPFPTNYCCIYTLTSSFLFLFLFMLFLSFFNKLLYSFDFIIPFFFSTDWCWVSRCFCGQLPSCFLSLTVEYILILPSWSCRNLMVDPLTNSLFWISSWPT